MSHLTLALTSAAATDSLSHVMMISIKLFQFTFPRGKPGTGGGFYHKMSIKTRKQVKRNSSAVCCEDTALLTAQDTRGQWSGPGDEADPASGLATVCTTALRGGGGRVTISHYNTHIPFPDFMPAHPRHKLQCSLQRP